MIATEIKVERYSWKRQGKEPRGYVEDQGQYQLLVKRWKWRGVTIWKRVLDSEEVPEHAWIEMATLGTCSWRSKFQEFIR